MTMTAESDPRCETCGEGHGALAAKGVIPKHSLNLGDIPVSATFGRRSNRDTPDAKKGAQRGSESPSTPTPGGPWPFDPVLRQALIDKGVLTPEDLRAAERKIHQVTSIFEGRTDGGESAESPRRGKVQE